MKILFCTDGSKISFNALKNISGWVKNATIDTICVIDWNILPSEVFVDEENFSYSCSNIANSILDYTKEEIEHLGLLVGNQIKNCGSVVESILEQTEKEDYDMVLMGSHGKKGLQKWLGSVSQEIINSSKISNYISKEENNKTRILITTDGSPCSTDIIKKVFDEINFTNKEIHICMVNEDPNFLFLDGTLDTNWLLDIQKQQHLYSEKAINSIKNIFTEQNISVHKTQILNGIPAQEIINYSNTNNIDLIILGYRNKSKMDRFLTGSVSKRVIENTMSDIWLVRCKN